MKQTFQTCLYLLVGLTWCGVLQVAKPAAADTTTITPQAQFRGKVVDPGNSPLGHVRIRLADTTSDEHKTASTNSDGQFWIAAHWTHPLDLEFTPGRASGLASAIFTNLPAGQDRQMIVHLVKGFPLTGLITFGGRALKGIVINIEPQDPSDMHEKIYGSGRACTKDDGIFTMVVAPGRKRLAIINRLYSNVIKETSREVTVSSDLNLGQIDLPAIQ